MRQGRVEVQEAKVKAQIGPVMAATMSSTRRPMRHQAHEVLCALLFRFSMGLEALLRSLEA